MRQRIIIVDDDEVLLELMSDVLTSEGYNVITVHGCETAYDTICREKPDCVILDVNVRQRYSGEMVLALMHVDPHTRDIPVILLSSNTRLGHSSPVLIEASVALLTKPFALHRLLHEVRAALDSTSR